LQSNYNFNIVNRYHNVDINVAVNTDNGLFTPLVRDVDRIGLSAIANSVKALAEKAKANKLTPEDFQV